MSVLLRAAARHLPTVIASLIVVLLGSGWLDPAPIVQVLDAMAPLVALLITRR